MKTLLILGATGKVGQALLEQALAHPDVALVTVPTRRPLAVRDARLQNPIIDFRALPSERWWKADAALCALGTTLRLAGSQVAFFEVDHDFVVAAARRARQAGTPCFVLNSALGANARAGNFYLRVKGQAEDSVAALGFESLTLVRPSMLDAGPREDPRPAERAGLLAMKLAAPLIPRRYRAVTVAAVARRMLQSALNAPMGRHVIESDAI